LPDFAPLEIRALAKIMEELDYYQLLHIERSASQRELKKAYYATSRTFHPDANRHLERELQADCATITKRLTEAYSVLRDARRRQVYDERLAQGQGLRIQIAQAKAETSKKDKEERQGRTPQGRQFHQKAQQELERGDTAAARRSLQMALTFEPDNSLFRDLLTSTSIR